MIITAHIGATFGGVLKYVHKANVNLPEEQKPIILEENHVHGTHQDQARLMNYVSKINSRSIYPVLHLTVSYPEKDNPTQKEVDKHLKEVIKGFGATAENNQYVIVAHRDSAKDIANRTAHYHIVINKVGFNGQNINTDWYKNNAQVVADKIEQQYDLTRTIGRDVLYDSDPKNEKGYKYATKKEKITALVTRKKAGKDYVISDKRKKVLDAKVAIAEKVGQALLTSRNPQELSSKLAEHGITIGVSVDKENNNAIRGISFKSEEIKVGGKEIGYSWQTINDTFHVNQAKSLEIDNVAPVQTAKEKIAENRVEERKALLAREVDKIIADSIIKSHVQNIDTTIVQPPRQVPELAKNEEIKEKEPSQSLSAKEILAQKNKSNLDQAIAPGATPTLTPTVEPFRKKEEPLVRKERNNTLFEWTLSEKEKAEKAHIPKANAELKKAIESYPKKYIDLVRHLQETNTIQERGNELVISIENNEVSTLNKEYLKGLQPKLNEKYWKWEKEMKAYKELISTPIKHGGWFEKNKDKQEREQKNKEIESAVEPPLILLTEEDKKEMMKALEIPNPYIEREHVYETERADFNGEVWNHNRRIDEIEEEKEEKMNIAIDDEEKKPNQNRGISR